MSARRPVTGEVICFMFLQSVPARRCPVTVQLPVRIPARTCGHTLSVYLDPARRGAHALVDRCVCVCVWLDSRCES